MNSSDYEAHSNLKYVAIKPSKISSRMNSKHYFFFISEPSDFSQIGLNLSKPQFNGMRTKKSLLISRLPDALRKTCVLQSQNERAAPLLVQKQGYGKLLRLGQIYCAQ